MRILTSWESLWLGLAVSLIHDKQCGLRRKVKTINLEMRHLTGCGRSNIDQTCVRGGGGVTYVVSTETCITLSWRDNYGRDNVRLLNSIHEIEGWKRRNCINKHYSQSDNIRAGPELSLWLTIGRDLSLLSYCLFRSGPDTWYHFVPATINGILPTEMDPNTSCRSGQCPAGPELVSFNLPSQGGW